LLVKPLRKNYTKEKEAANMFHLQRLSVCDSMSYKLVEYRPLQEVIVQSHFFLEQYVLSQQGEDIIDDTCMK
jgi:hypothetical protein